MAANLKGGTGKKGRDRRDSEGHGERERGKERGRKEQRRSDGGSENKTQSIAVQVRSKKFYHDLQNMSCMEYTLHQ